MESTLSDEHEVASKSGIHYFNLFPVQYHPRHGQSASTNKEKVALPLSFNYDIYFFIPNSENYRL